jgi:hypothetical protein
MELPNRFHLALVLIFSLLTDYVQQVFSTTETETLRHNHSVFARMNITQNIRNKSTTRQFENVWSLKVNIDSWNNII